MNSVIEKFIITPPLSLVLVRVHINVLVDPSLRNHPASDIYCRLFAPPILVVVIVVQVYQARHYVPTCPRTLVRYQVLDVVRDVIVDLSAFALSLGRPR